MRKTLSHRMARHALLPAFLLISLALLLAGCTTAPTRPGLLPPAAGRKAAGLRGPVSIIIDAHGIPHVSARNEADLAFAMGYMHARDRRFQMELLRMDSLGRLREFLGARVPRAVLRLEIISRSLGFDQEARALAAELPEEDQRLLSSYADGVNLATRTEPRPFEFRLLGYVPEPWTPEDSLAILQAVSFGFCKNWEQELVRLEIAVFQLRKGFTIHHALGIWPLRFDLPPHLIGRKPGTDPFASIPPVAPELAAYLEQTFGAEGLASALETRPGPLDAPTDALSSALDLRFLSNNWAVDGAWTGTGRSVFAVDPHMPSSLPPLPYLVSLSLDSPAEGTYTVAGAGIPGLPAVVFGTNGRVAWGPTSNWADVTDLYVEKEAPDRPGYYETEKGDLPFLTRQETFLVRHGSTFTREERTVRATRHGVILNDFIDRLPGDFPLVAIARAQTFGSSFRSMSRLYRSATVSEARSALNGLTAFVGHWVLADSQGNIGYASPVNLPIRTSFLGTFPVPGWNGEYEWKGFVPAAELPGVENPPRGFIATANNQVVQPESTGYPLNFEGDEPFRVERINQRLALGRSGSDLLGQMSLLQADGRDNSFQSVRSLIERGIAPLADAPSPLLASAARTLLSWDGNTDPDSPAPTLYQSLLTTLMDTLLSGEVSPPTLDFLLFYFNTDPLIFGMLDDPANPVWRDIRAKTGRDREGVVAMCFRLTVAALSKKYGSRLTGWTWRRAAPVTLSHPLGSIPGFGFLNRGGIPPRGTASSVWMHKYDRRDPARFPVIYGPGLRLVVDFNDPSRCLVSLPGGQSGRPASRHYGDMLPLFETGKGVTLDLDLQAAERNAEASLLFQP